jgi:GNAT superfamily N-acetyltransferase
MIRTIELNNVQIRKLNTHEQVPSFDCGDDDFNDFILNDSILYRKELLAVSYVMEDAITNQIIAYFSLANDKITLTDFPDKNIFNRFRRKRFVNQKRLKSYPTIKICRLAVDKKYQGLSCGKLLINFIKAFVIKDTKAGCRFLTVDAYVDATPFYEKNGFEPLDSSDKSDHTRLYFYDLKETALKLKALDRNITEDVIKVARNLKSLGVSVDIISQATPLTEEEINKL